MGRLETLTDAVFAIVLVLLVAEAPRPDHATFDALGDWLLSMLEGLVSSLIGLVVVLTYWVKSNQLFGMMDRTDSVHASISILQVFFVLVYLYAVSLGLDLGEHPLTLALQSSGAALIGVAGTTAFWYAGHRRRLIEESVSDAEVMQLRVSSLAEPATALLTLPFAFLSATLWELSWLAYPVIVKLLDRPVSRVAS